MSMPKINDYDLLEIIGTGSYSTVHRARNKETKNYYAIKCVAKANLSKMSTDNLIREIKLLKTLKHKHIVEMIDFRWDEKNIYIIMELCDGGNLSTYIKKHQTLPECTCKFFMKQLASALKYMRSNNVSHFDLKPQNLLLVRNPVLALKVADFGFAQYLALSEENTVIKGSPLYMAPEILLKHSYNPSADLWSIGVILYECLFGQAPYSSKTIDELLHKIKTKRKIEIPKYTKISMDCRDILTRLLIDDPAQRITFQEFFDHKFLDLDHQPYDENLTKAIELVTKAVEQDEKQNYREAYYLYCEGLHYFIPLIVNENDAGKRGHLENRAMAYMERAEEIKRSMQRANELQRQLSQNSNSSETSGEGKENNSNSNSNSGTSGSKSLRTQPSVDSGSGVEEACVALDISKCNIENKGGASQHQPISRTKSNISTDNPILSAITPSSHFKNLHSLFASMPAAQNALDTGRQAELYTYEQNFQSALELFTAALNVLVPMLRDEPNGARKVLLQQQILDWMKEAESLKTLLSIHNLKNDKTGHHQHCCLQ